MARTNPDGRTDACTHIRLTKIVTVMSRFTTSGLDNNKASLKSFVEAAQQLSFSSFHKSCDFRVIRENMDLLSISFIFLGSGLPAFLSNFKEGNFVS